MGVVIFSKRFVNFTTPFVKFTKWKFNMGCKNYKAYLSNNLRFVKFSTPVVDFLRYLMVEKFTRGGCNFCKQINTKLIKTILLKTYII